MPHDIIDNREQQLVDSIKQMLASSESAKFAVGYLFLSGLEAVGSNLGEISSLRLLIGNTSSRETIEQVVEGYQHLNVAMGAEERERFLKRSEHRRRVTATAENVRHTAEKMDQTDQGEQLIQSLIRMIEEARLQVRVFTKGRLHAKAYIFDYVKDGRFESGIAVVGSSNLSLSGLTHNTELNVVVHGNENHRKLSDWFEDLWEDSQEFDRQLMDELQQSWAAAIVTPYDVYMKTIYALVSDRLDEGEHGEILWDDELTRALADFQKTAVRQAVQMIRDHGGAFISDVVGLGKSYMGAAVVKHFVRTQGAKPLIICPKALEEMWHEYNEDYSLDAKVLPMSMLRFPNGTGAKTVLGGNRYRDRDFVLIDESHNFRHHSSQRYEVLADFLSRGQKKVCLLTATPRNRAASDVLNQIKLFHPDDITHLPIDPPNLKEYFKGIEKGEKRLQDLLIHVLIRRTRRHILRWYGFASDTSEPLRRLSDVKAADYLDGQKKAYVMVGGTHQYFPARELETLTYSIEDTYEGLYDQIRSYLGGPQKGKYSPSPGVELTYARYGLWNYVRPEKQKVPPYKDLHGAGVNLRGLIRVMLFKRLESSVYAFRRTLERLERIHGVFLEALDQGFVPAGQAAQKLMYESDVYDDAGLIDDLFEVSGRYDIEDFDSRRLKRDLEADRMLLLNMISLVEPIGAPEDDKLQVLLNGLQAGIPKERDKVLIFSQFADTAEYLFEHIAASYPEKRVDSIFGTDKSKARMAARFSPLSNPAIEVNPDREVDILVATDVMSEGLNLQDCDVIVNYDLHWNPVRLIQRFGRIDRIGTENEQVWAFNFLPELKLENNLGLHDVLRRRIQEIHDSIGEDAAILDKDEQLNEEAMFAIYEKKGGQLSLFEDEDGEFLDIGEAEELMRSLRATEPEEYERIASLRDGIRSARSVFSETGRFVFCQAGKYQQLVLTDLEGNVITRELPAVLGRIKCSITEPAAVMPSGHNHAVMNVLEAFRDEVRHRQAQQQHSLSLTAAQRYTLRELRAYYSQLEEDETDLKSQVVRLEQAFRRPATAATRRQLNTLRRNGVSGVPLIRALTELYHDHGLDEKMSEDRRTMEEESDSLPRIICSEALI
jgi:late competence protein required for DNA uptake (superfamily II DNA/RNA helicase)